LVGAEHKTPFTITNTFDEVEVIPGHDKLFALWPIFFRNRLNLGTTNVLRQDMLLPLYSFQRSPARDHTSYLFPFFNYADDRENKYRQWDFPFPFISVARGEGKTMNRFLPFYSYAETPILTRQSILWPLYHHATAKVDPLDRERTRVLFFLYSNLRERNTASEQERRRVDLWPLFTKRKDFDGTERLQILAPVEPLLPNNKSIERNYSIVWSLWRSEQNPNTGAASTSVLWNLYRSDRAAGVKKVSFLFGLIQVESSPEHRRWRWFHLPVKPVTAPAAGNK
jgi:hypothetical protein